MIDIIVAVDTNVVVDTNVADISVADTSKNNSIEHTSILEYLTNPSYYSIIKKKKTDKTNTVDNKDDIKFYRKRIIALTKDMMKGDVPSKGLKEIHDDYIKSIIKYFKIVDKTDIIQEQYEKELSLNNDNEDVASDSDTIENANELMMKKPILNSNLNNFVISTSTQPSETRIIPVKLDIDLNSPSLKKKGLKPKGLKPKKLMKQKV